MKHSFQHALLDQMMMMMTVIYGVAIKEPFIHLYHLLENAQSLESPSAGEVVVVGGNQKRNRDVCHFM